MSVQPALLAIGILGFLAAEASAQTDLAVYDVGLGIRVGVPTSWVLTNAEGLIAILERSPTAVRKPTLEAFREMAANSEDALLFRANDPGVPSNSTQMNVSVAPAMTIGAFVNEEDVEAVVAYVCEGFAGQAEAYGGIDECVWHETEIIEDRYVLILEQEALVTRLHRHRAYRGYVPLPRAPAHARRFPEPFDLRSQPGVGHLGFRPAARRQVMLTVMSPDVFDIDSAPKAANCGEGGCFLTHCARSSTSRTYRLPGKAVPTLPTSASALSCFVSDGTCHRQRSAHGPAQARAGRLAIRPADGHGRRRAPEGASSCAWPLPARSSFLA